MIVTVDGQPVKIEFQYKFTTAYNSNYAAYTKKLRITSCYITAKIYGQEVFFLGKCSQHYKDIDNKETARKVALKRALESLGVPSENGISILFTKNQRAQVWQQYLSRSKTETALDTSQFTWPPVSGRITNIVVYEELRESKE